MSVSTQSDLEELLRRRLRFAGRHQWVYDVQVTRFFTERWCERIPAEWRDCLVKLDSSELNNLPFGACKATWPQSLKAYVSESAELAFPRLPPPSVVGGAIPVRRSVAMGMKAKKLHEVALLSGVIRELCATHGCKVVVDIGSGLGYLGHCLSEECGLCVVGLEEEGTRVRAARGSHDDAGDGIASSCDQDCASCDSHVTRNWTEQVKKLPLDFSRPFQRSLKLTIDNSESTLAKLNVLLSHLVSKGPVGVCLVGLHCCGDLTPALLCLLPSLSPSPLCALLVGCCYHKSLRLATPLSAVLRSEVGGVKGDFPNFELSTFGLRLAAQETREKWCQQGEEEHSGHMTRVAWRAVLEGVWGENPLPRKALRGVRCRSFAEYAHTLAHNLNDVSLEDRLHRRYSECEPLFPFIEPFTALQVCMQGVLEGVVLLDWLALLRGAGLEAHTLPVFDPSISPRNIAIVIAPSK